MSNSKITNKRHEVKPTRKQRQQKIEALAALILDAVRMEAKKKMSN